MTLAIIALSVYTATYVAEVMRSGFNTVPVGQAEAARAIGLPFGQTMSLVILPQALRAVIPPMMSVFIALLKNTTVAAGSPCSRRARFGLTCRAG
jgi:ABC-type amino acid transport system permease subunit